MRTLVAKEVDNMIFVYVCGETSKVMETWTDFGWEKNRGGFFSV